MQTSAPTDTKAVGTEASVTQRNDDGEPKMKKQKLVLPLSASQHEVKEPAVEHVEAKDLGGVGNARNALAQTHIGLSTEALVEAGLDPLVFNSYESRYETKDLYKRSLRKKLVASVWLKKDGERATSHIRRVKDVHLNRSMSIFPSKYQYSTCYKSSPVPQLITVGTSNANPNGQIPIAGASVPLIGTEDNPGTLPPKLVLSGSQLSWGFRKAFYNDKQVFTSLDVFMDQWSEMPYSEFSLVGPTLAYEAAPRPSKKYNWYTPNYIPAYMQIPNKAYFQEYAGGLSGIRPFDSTLYRQGDPIDNNARLCRIQDIGMTAFCSTRRAEYNGIPNPDPNQDAANINYSQGTALRTLQVADAGGTPAMIYVWDKTTSQVPWPESSMILTDVELPESYPVPTNTSLKYRESISYIMSRLNTPLFMRLKNRNPDRGVVYTGFDGDPATQYMWNRPSSFGLSPTIPTTANPNPLPNASYSAIPCLGENTPLGKQRDAYLQDQKQLLCERCDWGTSKANLGRFETYHATQSLVSTYWDSANINVPRDPSTGQQVYVGYVQPCNMVALPDLLNPESDMTAIHRVDGSYNIDNDNMKTWVKADFTLAARDRSNNCINPIYDTADDTGGWENYNIQCDFAAQCLPEYVPQAFRNSLILDAHTPSPSQYVSTGIMTENWNDLANNVFLDFGTSGGTKDKVATFNSSCVNTPDNQILHPGSALGCITYDLNSNVTGRSQQGFGFYDANYPSGKGVQIAAQDGLAKQWVSNNPTDPGVQNPTFYELGGVNNANAPQPSPGMLNGSTVKRNIMTMHKNPHRKGSKPCTSSSHTLKLILPAVTLNCTRTDDIYMFPPSGEEYKLSNRGRRLMPYPCYAAVTREAPSRYQRLSRTSAMFDMGILHPGKGLDTATKYSGYYDSGTLDFNVDETAEKYASLNSMYQDNRGLLDSAAEKSVDPFNTPTHSYDNYYRIITPVKVVVVHLIWRPKGRNKSTDPVTGQVEPLDIKHWDTAIDSSRYEYTKKVHTIRRSVTKTYRTQTILEHAEYELGYVKIGSALQVVKKISEPAAVPVLDISNSANPVIAAITSVSSNTKDTDYKGSQTTYKVSRHIETLDYHRKEFSISLSHSPSKHKFSKKDKHSAFPHNYPQWFHTIKFFKINIAGDIISSELMYNELYMEKDYVPPSTDPGDYKEAKVPKFGTPRTFVNRLASVRSEDIPGSFMMKVTGRVKSHAKSKKRYRKKKRHRRR